MLNCAICTKHCCGGSPLAAPVLLPDEALFFQGYTTPDGGLQRLLRKEDGTCWFLLPGNHCSIYSFRPTECRTYPYIFCYKDGALGLTLHGGCPQKELAPAPAIPANAKALPASFWLEFEKLKS